MYGSAFNTTQTPEIKSEIKPISGRNPRKRHRSSRRQFRNGQRAAVIRALAAARLYASDPICSLMGAATSCGSNVPYIRAAITLVKSEQPGTLRAALSGDVSLLQAAAQITCVADLVAAYRRAGASDRILFGRTIGPEAVFSTIVEPALN
jgi:hypothetical protein